MAWCYAPGRKKIVGFDVMLPECHIWLGIEYFDRASKLAFLNVLSFGSVSYSGPYHGREPVVSTGCKVYLIHDREIY